jgi:hypothetical protein
VEHSDKFHRDRAEALWLAWKAPLIPMPYVSPGFQRQSIRFTAVTSAKRLANLSLAGNRKPNPPSGGAGALE